MLLFDVDLVAPTSIRLCRLSTCDVGNVICAIELMNVSTIIICVTEKNILIVSYAVDFEWVGRCLSWEGKNKTYFLHL